MDCYTKFGPNQITAILELITTIHITVFVCKSFSLHIRVSILLRVFVFITNILSHMIKWFRLRRPILGDSNPDH